MHTVYSLIDLTLVYIIKLGESVGILSKIFHGVQTEESSKTE